MIEKYLQFIRENKKGFNSLCEWVESSSVEISESIIGGKGMFISFLKSITSLGQKECKPVWDKCPNNFIIYYYFMNLNSESVKQVFSRFRSLSSYIDLIDYGKNEVNLYFGIKCNGQFEYGISYDSNSPIGQFKLTPGVIKWICQIDSKSASSLKKEIINLKYEDIINLGKIKTDMLDYNPGYHEDKVPPKIDDKVISFEYRGVGKWENGQLDQVEYSNIKNNFVNWVLGKKWGNKVLIKIEPKSYSIIIHLKLK